MTGLGIVGGAFLACAVGGILPWLSAEVALVGAAYLLPASGHPVLILACAGGQMAAKSAVFCLARWAPERLPDRARRLPAWAERYRDRRRASMALLLSGALVSVPPFYVVTVLSALTRLPIGLFVLAGAAGTLVRYAALVWLSQYLVTS
ncbi:MAG: hypothetical protein Q8N53_12520 [Longimicrobiales bacterium]|nr:hypothetical protein [Longimicrobiales bacterium]